MNFMAFEYWTDGWRDGSLMPNDEGLRRCKCGQYVLVRDMVAVDTADSSELPYMDWVPDEQLPECIAQAGSDEIEVAARLGYWRHLNHPYRERYRQHRDADLYDLANELFAARNPCLNASMFAIPRYAMEQEGSHHLSASGIDG